MTSYRNPAIAEGLKTLGLVERFGFGLTRAQQTLADNGNPPLRGVFEANHCAIHKSGRGREDDRILQQQRRCWKDVAVLSHRLDDFRVGRARLPPISIRKLI